MLKANNEKANWSYGPKIGSILLLDTTAKIAGQEVAAQCELRSEHLQQTVPQSAVEEIYSLDAVIAKTDAGTFSAPYLLDLSNHCTEASKIHNVGYYVSVDGRPVNATRSTAKDIVKLYKSFYRAASGNADRTSSTANPFLYMHIRCPQESYDINIEPAKDDLLFSEPTKIIALVEKLFRDYYGEPATANMIRSQSLSNSQAATRLDDNFDLLLARKTSKVVEKRGASRSTDPTPLTADVSKFTGVADAEPLAHARGGVKEPPMDPDALSSRPRNRSSPRPLYADERSDRDRSKPHVNMYGIDDDDLLTTGSSVPIQPAASEEMDEDDVRSARVTNPWSLARLHAPVRRSVTKPSIQPDPGAGIQLMTPGFEESDPTRKVQQRPARRDFIYQQSNLPSPTASSPTPAAYQNPGPPLRRKACHDQQSSGDDDIEYTQDVIGETSESRHANTLETWVRPRQPTAHPPSFQRASIPHEGDDRFDAPARARFERRDGSLDKPCSTQLTGPNAPLSESSGISNSLRKPFKSLFKGASDDGFRSTANLTRPDATSTSVPLAVSPYKARVPLGNGSPLSHRRLWSSHYDNTSTLMPPPPSPSHLSFKLSQSPNPELADILEFEQRKKAAVLHQRRSRSSLALDELNPARLAHVQRKSNDLPLLRTVSSQMRRNLPSLDLREDQTNPARELGPRHPNPSDQHVENVTYRNSPHRNRYLAAKERLDPAHLESSHKRDEHHRDSAECNAGNFLDEFSVRLSKDDPREYLLQHSENAKNFDSLTGLTKTGLKIRRTKTTKLPLETIPADAANHGLKVIAPDPFPSALALAIMSRRQGQFDEYVRSGENSFVRWSANSKDVKDWETTLKELISKSFNARLVGEIVAPDFTVMLTTAIKAHADARGP